MLPGVSEGEGKAYWRVVGILKEMHGILGETVMIVYMGIVVC